MSDQGSGEKGIGSMAKISQSASGLITVSQLAGELGISELGARRLIARGRIAHYVQSDGSAMIEPAALADFYRRGSPDLHGPRISGEWFAGADLDLLARHARQQIADSIAGEITDAGESRLEVKPGPAATRVIRDTLAAPTGQSDHPSHARLHFVVDSLLAVQMRRSALNLIRRGGYGGGAMAIEKLYASREQYLKIVRNASSAMLGSALVSFQTGGTSVIVRAYEVVNSSDVDRIAYAAF